MMKRNIRHFLTGIFLSFLASGCESDFDGNITGTYSNQTDTLITTIHVQATGQGYRFSCIFDDNRESNLGKSYEWKGTFQNVPADKVLDADSQEIGTVEFSEGEVTFKAKTKRPGTYKAYADDMADIMGRKAANKKQ
ncbi:MAG: hypothetical protein ACLTOV_05070 [Phocaeicola sp.]